jgi:acetylxylan esterase
MLALLSTSAAHAASLQRVNHWGATGVPSDAQAAFGQAQGGGIVKAADRNGFVLVVPSSDRCWDVVSNETRLRDGGGDSPALRQMLKCALQADQANPDRVYSTGASSGG